jgi:hypothetical protein
MYRCNGGPGECTGVRAVATSFPDAFLSDLTGPSRMSCRAEPGPPNQGGPVPIPA